MHRILLALLITGLSYPIARVQAQQATTTYAGQPSSVWVARLKDEDYTVRLRAAYALGQIQPPVVETIPALIQGVDDRAQEVRWYSADSLGRLGAAAQVAVPVLLAGVKDPANDKPFAVTAAQALGRIGPAAEEAVPWLVEALRDGHAPLRNTAALALWRIKRHPNALATLTESLAEPSGEGAYLAGVALLELGPDARPAAASLVKALSHPSADARRAAARVLGKLGPEMIAPLSKALGGTLKSAEARESALAALAILIDDARTGALYNPRATPEEFAAAGRNCLEFAVPSLVKLFSEPVEGVRLAAIRAASKIGLPAVPSLLTALSDENELVQAAATDALIRLEGDLPRGPRSKSLAATQQSLATPLIAALKQREPAVRGPAVRLFAELSWGPEAQAALPHLRDALKSEDPLVRRNAARALEQVQKGGGT